MIESYKHQRLIDIRASKWVSIPEIAKAMLEVESKLGVVEEVKYPMCVRNLRKWRLDVRGGYIYVHDVNNNKYQVDSEGKIKKAVAEVSVPKTYKHGWDCDHFVTEQFGVVSSDMKLVNGLDAATTSFFLPVSQCNYFVIG